MAKALILTSEERKYLERQTRARTIRAQIAARARILLLKADGQPIDTIADKVDLNRKSVMLCLSKYKAGGIENALFDAPGRGRNTEITDDEKTWIKILHASAQQTLGMRPKRGHMPNFAYKQDSRSGRL